jgi:hypothetical protein
MLVPQATCTFSTILTQPCLPFYVTDKYQIWQAIYGKPIFTFLSLAGWAQCPAFSILLIVGWQCPAKPKYHCSLLSSCAFARLGLNAQCFLFCLLMAGSAQQNPNSPAKRLKGNIL